MAKIWLNIETGSISPSKEVIYEIYELMQKILHANQKVCVGFVYMFC